MILGQLDNQKNEPECLPHSIHKKFLEENIRVSNHDHEFSDGFLDMTPKAQGKKKWIT